MRLSMARRVSLTLTIVLLPVWQFLGATSATVRLFISTPALSFEYASHHFGTLMIALAYTSAESVMGLIIALLLTALIALPCFFRPGLLRVLTPIFVTSQTIPLITLAPLFIVLFGINLSSKILMAALLCFFPMFVSLVSAYTAIPSPVHMLAFLYDAPVLRRVRHIDIPLATPGLFAGLKVSTTLCVVGAIVAEFNGANFGLGRNLFIAAKRLDAELMVDSLVLSSVLGMTLYSLVVRLERIVGFWYVDSETKEGTHQ